MRELILRLSAHPFLTTELLLASLFANILGLASSIYVIQIFNRYLSYGIDSTLITLTTGVLIALLLEFGFQRVRLRLAASIGKTRNQQLISGAFNVLTRAKTSALQRLSPSQRQEVMQGPDIIADAYSAVNLATLLDLPFILLFLAALFFLSPLLGTLTVIVIFALALFCFIHQRRLRQQLTVFNKTGGKTRGIINLINQDIDTIRLFEHQQLTRQTFEQHSALLTTHKSELMNAQNLLQTVMKLAQSLLTVAIYALGASLTVHGELDIGLLIAANILALRTLAPVSRVAQLSATFIKATEALEQLQRFAQLETERSGGSALKHYSGSLVFKDIAFSYTGMPRPLYERLDLTVTPGSVIAVIGENGTGKSTLARLIVGLLEPSRGQLLIDGVDLRQIAPSWWRAQIGYLPQDSHFLPGTIRDNLLNANPDLTDQQINQMITDADFAEFIDNSQEGLDTQVLNGGTNFTLGQKRRFALARALAANSKLMLLDEPTEGLDRRGCQALYKLLIKLSHQGRTLIIFSQDSHIINSAPLLLDLTKKPIPQLVTNPRQARS